MHRQDDEPAYRFRLSELFVWTAAAAVYALAVRWSLYQLSGNVAVAFVASAIGTVLRRRWAQSRNIFANGLIGGTLGGIVGSWIATIVAYLALNGMPTNLIDASFALDALFFALTFGLMFGSLFGVLFAFIFEEFCTAKRIMKKRRDS